MRQEAERRFAKVHFARQMVLAPTGHGHAVGRVEHQITACVAVLDDVVDDSRRSVKAHTRLVVVLDADDIFRVDCHDLGITCFDAVDTQLHVLVREGLDGVVRRVHHDTRNLQVLQQGHTVRRSTQLLFVRQKNLAIHFLNHRVTFYDHFAQFRRSLVHLNRTEISVTAYRQIHANRLIADIRTFQHKLAGFGFQTELSVRVRDRTGHYIASAFAF